MPLVRVPVQPRLLGWSVHLSTGDSWRYKDRRLDRAKGKHPRLKKGNTRRVIGWGPCGHKGPRCLQVIPIGTEKHWWIWRRKISSQLNSVSHYWAISAMNDETVVLINPLIIPLIILGKHNCIELHVLGGGYTWVGIVYFLDTFKIHHKRCNPILAFLFLLPFVWCWFGLL